MNYPCFAQNHTNTNPSTFARLLAVLLMFSAAIAQEYRPPIADESDEGTKAIRNFAVPDDMKVELIAAEPMLANPVAFYIDYKGDIYVAETFRHQQGVTDMRNHTEWLLDDLASRTVEDRLIAMKKNLGADFAAYADEHDRVRLLRDTDDDGLIDTVTVFADGFRDALAGIGAGVLVDEGSVYYTCIPELWKLRDENGDGIADTREVLSSGYGVHINFLGHDLHGLRKGPDGRIYFSIGDRGAYIKTFDGHVIDEPDTGAVYRCFPDGSGLEIVHRGLRNPQELAFDDHGNLFSGDNNSDGGDQARLVWIVPGGDSGWRIGYQWMTKPVTRGPWNAEKMWHPFHEGQPAHLVPPLANIGAGPSGLTHYPGTGLPDRYADHFFLCDFRGDAGHSLIHSFAVEPKGASFEMVDRQDFAEHMLATDVDFGMDGGIYFSDWVQGWDQPLKGRIYRIHAPALDNDPLIQRKKEILANGMDALSDNELTDLLSFADQRVRQEAQFELVQRGASDQLAQLALAADDQLPRLHAIWGLWQFALAGQPKTETLLALTKDKDPEIRAQAAHVLGDLRAPEAEDALHTLLTDDSPRVQFFAAIGLGRIGINDDAKTNKSLIALVRANTEPDPYLRHAGVVAMTGMMNDEALAAFTQDSSSEVRLSAVLALRRQQSPMVAEYLSDSDPFIVQEAARAINDAPIPAAYPALAALLGKADTDDEQLTRRIINAHLLSATASNTEALAQYAAAAENPTRLRVAALEALKQWENPYPLDAVSGAFQPRPGGDADDARDVVTQVMPALLKEDDDDIFAMLVDLAGHFKLESLSPALFELVADKDRSTSNRIGALDSLAQMQSERLADAIAIARASDSSRLRLAAIAHMSRIDTDTAVPLLIDATQEGTTSERQFALQTLGQITHEEVDHYLLNALQEFENGKFNPELQVELLEAVRHSKSSEVHDNLEAWLAEASADDPLAPYRATLEGGSSREGRDVFFENVAASCVRCHSYKGEGGGEVGPDLTEINKRGDREYILESIVQPNAKIAVGFENVTLTLKDGSKLTGRVLSEDDIRIELELAPEEEDIFAEETIPHSTVDVIAEGDSGAPALEVTMVSKSDVEKRQRNLSAMPEGNAEILSLREIRNLVEFLAR